MTKPKDVVKQIRKATRRKFSAEEKIRIVLEGLRGQIAVSDLCRREGILGLGFAVVLIKLFMAPDDGWWEIVRDMVMGISWSQ